MMTTSERKQSLFADALRTLMEQEFNKRTRNNTPEMMAAYVGMLSDAEKRAALKPIYVQMRVDRENQRAQLDAVVAAEKAERQQILDDDIAALVDLER